jgi:release factor glutamine methyltransferase
MTVNEARQKILHELKDIYEISEALNVADMVLEKVTGHTRTEQIVHNEIFLSPDEIENLKKIIVRLKNNEPVQYAIEEAWFANTKLKVNKNVLIPRPETEELVEWVVKDINAQYSMLNVQCSILDIGTGSGCIPIAIKKKLPKAEVSAIEVCSEAIFTATENAAAAETEIEFILLDFLDETKWNKLGKYNIIISNPPYVMQKEKASMHEKVIAYEPHLALFVPDDDSLLFYRKLADFSLLHLNPLGKLFVEINESLGNDVVNLFRSKGFDKLN